MVVDGWFVQQNLRHVVEALNVFASEKKEEALPLFQLIIDQAKAEKKKQDEMKHRCFEKAYRDFLDFLPFYSEWVSSNSRAEDRIISVKPYDNTLLTPDSVILKFCGDACGWSVYFEAILTYEGDITTLFEKDWACLSATSFSEFQLRLVTKGAQTLMLVDDDE